MRMLASLALVIAASLPLVAAADDGRSIYTCRDRNGRTITSDRPIAECSDRAMRELGPSGIVKREIAPPLTAEQQKQKEFDDRNRRLADEAAREKRRRDTALLSAYADEDQIERARRRNLADTEEAIKRSQTRLVELGKEKASLVQETEGYRGKQVPYLVQRKVEDNRAAIADEEGAMRMQKAEIDRINLRFDEEVKRYRELVTARK